MPELHAYSAADDSVKCITHVCTPSVALKADCERLDICLEATDDFKHQRADMCVPSRCLHLTA